MSGVLGTLFGQSGTATATGTTTLPDWVNQAAIQNYQRAVGLSNVPYTAYPGQTVAPLTPAQNQAFQYVQNQLGAATPTFQQAIGNVSNMPALTNLPGATQSLLNPYLSNVESDTVSNINRAAALQGQQIAAGAQQGGAYGGTRYGVEQATLDSETQRNIGQAINQIQSQGWNTATQTALQQAGLGLNQANTLAGLATGEQAAGLQGAGALAQVGGAQQAQQQATLSNALQQWQQQQNYPYQQLAVAQSALAGTPYGTTVTSSQPYTVNQGANAIGTLSGLIPQLGGLVSGAGNLASSAYSGLSSLFGGGVNTTPTSIAPTGGAANFSEFGSGSVTPSTVSGGDLSGYSDLSGGSGSLLGNIGSGIGNAASSVGNWLGDAASSVGNFVSSLF